MKTNDFNQFDRDYNGIQYLAVGFCVLLGVIFLSAILG